MEKSSALLPSAIIALGIVVLGFTVRSGIVTFKDRDRIVSVKGLSEREVKADKVIWPLVYKDLGNDPAEMYRQLEKKNQKIVAFLKVLCTTKLDVRISVKTWKEGS